METLLPEPVGAPEERSSRAGVTSRVPRETTGVTTKPRVVTRPAGGEGPQTRGGRIPDAETPERNSTTTFTARTRPPQGWRMGPPFGCGEFPAGSPASLLCVVAALSIGQ